MDDLLQNIAEGNLSLHRESALSHFGQLNPFIEMPSAKTALSYMICMYIITLVHVKTEKNNFIT